MLRLELNSEEIAALAEVLSGTLTDLRMEIASTDRQDFREQLKAKKVVLQKVLDAVERQRQVVGNT